MLVHAKRIGSPAADRQRQESEQDRNFPMGIVSAGELNPGNVVMVEKTPLVVMKKAITRSGRNAAICKLRLRNLMTGNNTETVVKSEEKMEMVVLEKKECSYSYYAAPNHVFVDSEFNQYEIDAETIPELEKYLVPEMGETCEVTFFEGRPISVVLPKVIVREVEYTEPAARGDTSGKITKAAILKGTKHELQVSAFIEIGDKIEIDTTTDEFRGRCK
jgi:elongation factor P